MRTKIPTGGSKFEEEPQLERENDLSFQQACTSNKHKDCTESVGHDDSDEFQHSNQDNHFTQVSDESSTGSKECYEAKENRGEKTYSSRVFSDEQSIHLLACVDFSIQHKNIDFYSFAIERLGGEPRLSENQIRSKLIPYGRLQRLDVRMKVKLILEQGTKVLPDVQGISQVPAIIHALEKEYTLEHSKSIFPESSSVMKRSALNRKPQPLPMETITIKRILESEERNEFHPSKRSKVMPDSGSLSDFTKSKTNSPPQEKYPRTSSHLLPNHGELESQVTERFPQDKHTESFHELGSASTNPSVIIPVGGKSGKISVLPPASGVLRRRATSSLANQKVLPPPKDLVSSTKTIPIETSNLRMLSTPTDGPRLKSALDRINQLEEKLLLQRREFGQVQERKDTLEKELRTVKRVYETTQKHLHETLLQKETKIEDLLDQIKGCARISGFYQPKLSSTPRRNLNVSMTKGFGEIFRLSEDATVRCGQDRLILMGSMHKHHDLQELLCHALNQTDEKIMRAALKTASKVPRSLVRALTSVALQRWVFETDLPLRQVGDYPILCLYRQILRLDSKDGAITVKNIDFIAKSKLSIPGHELEVLAQKLTSRLTCALAPLFTQAPLEEKQVYLGIANWGHKDEFFQHRNRKFVQMFTEALKCKDGSRFNHQDYEILMVAPGTAFDPDSMVVGDRFGGIALDENSVIPEDKKVEICTSAGVKSFDNIIAAHSKVKCDLEVEQFPG
ncbi:hypothetical protein BJ875DRAFT_529239 [Amylocarpus encephaloides]|uniref:Uncharacterized protein n=1 Tax=Amylocarpus encephaloides TaxID=45428 RepID=A0A9P7YSH2_9HELO|nr:hypothetical protein BJ875DRAFT_529239 [Amylocarpus encephaloides]